MNDDPALWERAKAYDQEALAELYGQYAPLVYGYIYRRVGEITAAENLVGEVFVRTLKATRSRNGWRPSFRRQLYRSAHDVVVAHCRDQRDDHRMSIERPAGSNGGAPEEERGEESARESLISAVKGLPELEQQVLVLRFGEGFTARQTASVMGKSVSAVEGLQYRGLEALRRTLPGGG